MRGSMFQTFSPGFAALTRATNNKGKRNAGRRVVQPPRHTGAARAKRRALTFRRSTTALAAASQRRRSVPDALPGTWLRRGRYPPPPVPVQRLASQTGHHAGRAFPRTRPGAEVTPPPAGTALAPPTGVAGWRPLRERDSWFVTEMGTNVKSKVTITVTKFSDPPWRGVRGRRATRLRSLGELRRV